MDEVKKKNNRNINAYYRFDDTYRNAPKCIGVIETAIDVSRVEMIGQIKSKMKKKETNPLTHERVLMKNSQHECFTC